jgi:hypothetical protein
VRLACSTSTTASLSPTELLVHVPVSVTVSPFVDYYLMWPRQTRQYPLLRMQKWIIDLFRTKSTPVNSRRFLSLSWSHKTAFALAFMIGATTYILISPAVVVCTLEHIRRPRLVYHGIFLPGCIACTKHFRVRIGCMLDLCLCLGMWSLQGRSVRF